MARSYNYTGLTVSILELPEAGIAEIGVEVAGAWLPFGTVKLGGFHVDVNEAQDAAAAQVTAQPSEPTPTEPPTP